MLHNNILTTALAACLLATSIITACSDDDHTDDHTIASQYVVYTLNVDNTTDDDAIPITDVADFYVNYSDNNSNGQRRAESGKAYAYSHVTTFPYTVHFHTSAQLKPEAVIDPNAAYKINITTKWELTTEYKGTTKTGHHDDSNVHAIKLSGNHVKDYIDSWGERDPMDFTFDADGNQVVKN